ncbi:DNA-binding transcription factor [Aureococcus anophagefferens]|uniref:DNA-binding transcription factor n=1 Tax=Aureococcus anophagefferens TaxID=44056 RepID=A0ABR1G2M1_AURAN
MSELIGARVALTQGAHSGASGIIIARINDEEFRVRLDSDVEISTKLRVARPGPGPEPGPEPGPPRPPPPPPAAPPPATTVEDAIACSRAHGRQPPPAAARPRRRREFHETGRNAKQCRERWMQQCDPALSRAPWTRAEDAALLRCTSTHGRQVGARAQGAPGRTDQHVKRRCNSLRNPSSGLRPRALGRRGARRRRARRARARATTRRAARRPRRRRRCVARMAATLSCGRCGALFDDAAALPCGHIFCLGCVDAAFERSHECPTCGAACRKKDVVPSTVTNALVRIFKSRNVGDAGGSFAV